MEKDDKYTVGLLIIKWSVLICSYLTLPTIIILEYFGMSKCLTYTIICYFILLIMLSYQVFLGIYVDKNIDKFKNLDVVCVGKFSPNTNIGLIVTVTILFIYLYIKCTN